MFIGYDVFQDKVFQLGLERDKLADTVLQNVYRLVDHPFFQDYRGEGFTLLIEEFETLADRMEKIVNPSGGKVLYNRALTNEVIHPVLASMARSFGSAK